MTEHVVVTDRTYHKPLGATTFSQCGHAQNAERAPRDAIDGRRRCQTCFGEMGDTNRGVCRARCRHEETAYEAVPLDGHSRASLLDPCHYCFGGERPDVAEVLVLSGGNPDVYHDVRLFDGGEKA